MVNKNHLKNINYQNFSHFMRGYDKGFYGISKTKTGKAISDKYEDINFILSLNNESHKQVLSVAKLQNNILYN